jgi:hypothetical protein
MQVASISLPEPIISSLLPSSEMGNNRLLRRLPAGTCYQIDLVHFEQRCLRRIFFAGLVISPWVVFTAPFVVRVLGLCPWTHEFRRADRQQSRWIPILYCAIAFFTVFRCSEASTSTTVGGRFRSNNNDANFSTYFQLHCEEVHIRALLYAHGSGSRGSRLMLTS